MKLGSDGFIVYQRSQDNKIISQPFPALSTNLIDVSGAGDSLLSVMAIGLASGQSNGVRSIGLLYGFKGS